MKRLRQRVVKKLVAKVVLTARGFEGAGQTKEPVPATRRPEEIGRPEGTRRMGKPAPTTRGLEEVKKPMEQEK